MLNEQRNNLSFLQMKLQHLPFLWKLEINVAVSLTALIFLIGGENISVE